MEVNQRQVLRDLASIQYTRNDLDLGRGRFRVKGDVLEIGPAYEDRIIRVEFFGDEIDAIRYVDPVTGATLQSMEAVSVYPAKHFVTPDERSMKPATPFRMNSGIAGISGKRGQTAGGPAAGAAHPLRPGDDSGSGLLQRRGKLRPTFSRTGRRIATGMFDRLLPERLDAGNRRVPRHHSPNWRHVQRRSQPQTHPD
jgi:hypothetical protein